MPARHAADRYVRQGTDVPQIYPGTLDGLTRGLRDAQRLSERIEGVHRFTACYGKTRMTIREFQGGECIWAPAPELST